MELATHDETQRFLSGLWFRWGESIINAITKHYKLEKDQHDALLQILSKPNDWLVVIDTSLSSKNS